LSRWEGDRERERRVCGHLKGNWKRKRGEEEEGGKEGHFVQGKKRRSEGGCDLEIAGQAAAAAAATSATAAAAARQLRKTTAPHKQAREGKQSNKDNCERAFLKIIFFPNYFFFFW